jgi:hypothetical protein
MELVCVLMGRVLGVENFICRQWMWNSSKDCDNGLVDHWEIGKFSFDVAHCQPKECF